jgi:6-phosphogluconolactonase (cycloisomerase 2 family)
VRPRLALALALLVVTAGAAATLALGATSPPGALTQLDGPFGCFLGPHQAATFKASHCTTALGMGSTQHLAISTDGRFLYAASNDTWGLLAFRRNPQSGRLRQLPGPAGCVADAARAVAGCAPARGLVWAFWVTVSPDGQNVYASGGIGNALAVFRRDPVTGALTQLPGPDGCLRNRTGGTSRGGPTAEASGCRIVDRLDYPRTVTVSPDGRFVYAITFGGRTITGFARDPSTGALAPFAGGCVSSTRQKGCGAATALDGATDLTITRDGRFAYATAYSDGAVTAFARDVATGVLTQIPGPAGCIAETPTPACADGRALVGAFNLALSSDERQVYVAARGSKAIVVLNRDPRTGAIGQTPGAQGCVAAGAVEGCRAAIGLSGARGVAVAPDGRTVYAGAFTDSAITAFARKASSGELTQLPRPAGCAVFSGSGRGTPRIAGCTPARAVNHAWAVTVAGDGRYVYTGVGADGNSGIAVFRRR